ncbi:redoxin domain-containing protein (plasmid) [Haloferax larsenii]|uniref:thioredoxin-dependent peroxiredoxin n=1 Tax=Haloferax larsenii TaxID=302484 RepID=A0ABY5RLG1_HALLR|nr:redoxin domain-containing protein [Haloferax larsenii]
MLPLESTAPDFELPGTDGDNITSYRLSDALEHGGAVLVFYPFDFHPTCTEDLCTLRDFGWVDIRSDVTVFGISPDSVFSHREYYQLHDFDFALLSDSDRRIASQYDVSLQPTEGHSRIPRRTVFAIDETRQVRYRWEATGPDSESNIEAVVRAFDR